MRDNQKRMSAGAEPAPQASEPNAPALNFATPTEFVELPTKGSFYPDDHPLCGQETIEIKYMTARDEDILTSPTLLKKGLAIDRFLQNVIVDKRINISSMISGDKAAIMVASRINGFGSDYVTKVACPDCGETSENIFDLSAVEKNDILSFEDFDVLLTENNTFKIKLPRTKVEVEVRLLTGKDEVELAQSMQQKKKKKALETNLTDQIKKIVVSVNGVDDLRTINQFIQSMPAFDSRYLRNIYSKIVPGLNMRQDFSCENCGLNQEVDIPMTVDFFWSKQ
tara:strand:+ start:1627 stop:2469 length:843 start_codon:yes stop_codon:yes gene_type:complete